jgi:esterase
MDTKLHDSAIGEGPDVVLLHGLFGMGGNLGSLARSLQDRYRVHSVDLPDHGRSDWLHKASIPAYAEAVDRWMDERHLEEVYLFGHSLGGKVAMQLALDDPGRVQRLVIADIAPVRYPSSHDAVFEALHAVASTACHSRADAAALMARHLQEEMVIQFLLLSLKRDQDGIYRWRFNRNGLRDGYEALREPPGSDGTFDAPALFVAGALSNYVTNEHEAAVHALFSRAEIIRMADCGHWLHAEKPAEFNALVGDFLDA